MPIKKKAAKKKVTKKPAKADSVSHKEYMRVMDKFKPMGRTAKGDSSELHREIKNAEHTLSELKKLRDRYTAKRVSKKDLPYSVRKKMAKGK